MSPERILFSLIIITISIIFTAESTETHFQVLSAYDNVIIFLFHGNVSTKLKYKLNYTIQQVSMPIALASTIPYFYNQHFTPAIVMIKNLIEK